MQPDKAARFAPSCASNCKQFPSLAAKVIPSRGAKIAVIFDLTGPGVDFAGPGVGLAGPGVGWSGGWLVRVGHCIAEERPDCLE